MSVCLCVAIYRKSDTKAFQICTHAKAPQNSYSVRVDMMEASLSNSTLMNLLNATEDSSLCNSMPMNLLSARDRLCLEKIDDTYACMSMSTSTSTEQ